ncbi:DamX protein [Gammaproteobacteria bacterium]
MAAPAPPRTPALRSEGGGSDPFAPNTHYFFQEISRVQRLDLLYSLLHYDRSVSVLIGPPGAGKTTLLLQLQKRMRRTHPTALLTAYPELEAEPLLDEAQRQFNAALAAGGLEGAMEAVMLVDDADTLADVVLRVLLTPSSGQGSGQIRVLITGTPALEQRIASFSDLDPAARVLELLPFTEEDSARFVRARLEAAGIHSHPLLLPAALKRLHHESGGWPGAIVTRARAALNPVAARPGKTPKAAPPKKIAKPNNRPGVNRFGGLNRLGSMIRKSIRQAIRSYWLWPAMGVVTLAILFGLWPKDVPQVFSPTTVSTLPPPPARETPPTQPQPPTAEKSPSTATIHESPAATSTVEHPGSNPAPATHPPLIGPPRETVVASSLPLTSLATPPPVSTSPAQLSISATATGPTTAAHPAPTPLPAASTTSSPPQPVVATPAPPPSSPTPATSGGLQSEAWLRAQRPNDYTLQLMSGNSEAPLQEFLQRWKITGTMNIARTRRSGHDWFALLYGSYPNSHQAQEAIKQLPHGIGKPWTRTFGSVQQDLQPSNGLGR